MIRDVEAPQLLVASTVALVWQTGRNKHFHVRAKCLGLGKTVKNSVRKCFKNCSVVLLNKFIFVHHTISNDFHIKSLQHKMLFTFRKRIDSVHSFPYGTTMFLHVRSRVRRVVTLSAVYNAGFPPWHY